MDAKEFIDLCRRVALLPDGPLKIKEDVPEEFQVIYNGTSYYPTKRIAWFDGSGELNISGELHELKIHTTVIAPLKKIERKIKND